MKTSKRTHTKKDALIQTAQELYGFVEHMLMEVVSSKQGISSTLTIPYHIVMQSNPYQYPDVKLKCKITINWDGDLHGVDKKTGKLSRN